MLGVPGRAPGIILYALDVTFIDPLATRLVFERFLHVDRKEPPDVDIDIRRRPPRRGDPYVAEKYGYDRVAQIITFGTMGAGRHPRHRPRPRHAATATSTASRGSCPTART